MPAAALDPFSEPGRREAVLATARAYLAAGSLAAIYLDPTEPSRFARIAYTLLVAYLAYAVGLMVATRRGWAMSARATRAVHGVDLAWAAVISLFTAGPNSPFFLFFIFVLLAAAYRWGMKATLITAGVGTTLFLAQWFALHLPALAPSAEEVELNRFVMRAFYLAITGYLLAYLGESEKRLERETAAVARVLARARPDEGLRAAVTAACAEVFPLVGARNVRILVRDGQTGRRWVWNARLEGAEVVLEGGEVPSTPAVATFLAAAERGPGAFRARREGSGFEPDLVVPPGSFAGTIPEEVAPGASQILAVGFEFGRTMSAWLVVVDPAQRNESALRRLTRVAREVAPAIHNVYLVRRLRARASAVERARVARELHDGVIQALLGLEMEVDVLRREAERKDSGHFGALTHIQAHLRNEILTVRELMDRMRPAEVGPGDLLEALAQLVQRFAHQTGIVAHFTSTLEEVRLPARACQEVVRLVQEALANIRRHAQARNVVVRLEGADGEWLLVVDDDGRGFPFAGRLEHEELEESRKGPLVIKERVRTLGGRLTIESRPGGGSRLEIRFPGRRDWLLTPGPSAS